MKPLSRIHRFIRYNIIRIKRLRGNPRAIAGGIAIGVLIGLSPTVPFHTPLIIGLALLTRSSILAAISVSWLVCNPLTFFPIYYISAQIGNHITPYEINIAKLQLLVDKISGGMGFHESLQMITSLGGEAVIVLLAGGFVFSLPFAFLSYYLAQQFYSKREQKRLKEPSKALTTS